MPTLLLDLRYALRALARDRMLAGFAIACLALGIGANATVYTAARALIIHPLPTPESERLVMIAERPPRERDDDFESIAPANLVDWRRMTHTLDRIAAYAWWDVNVTGIDDPERVTGFRVTPEFFRLLGEPPLLGRTFTDAEGEAGSEPTVVLSHPFWVRRFGGDPAVVGRIVRLNGTPHRVIGIMRESFIFPPGAELWAPLPLNGALALDRDGRTLHAFARLRVGATIADARAEADVIAPRLAAQYPDVNGGWGMRVEPADRFYSHHARPYLLLLLGAVGFVLLIACANVANLLLARSVTRGRELAVRVAIGATRAHLARQLLAESAVLAIVGGGAGVLLALSGVLVFRSALPAELVKFNPGWTRIALDVHALAFTVAMSIATAFIVGVVPAFVASGADPQQALAQGGRGGVGASRHRLRSALVVGELALALMLLVGTGLMVRSFAGLMRADPGYRPDHALTMRVTLPSARYANDSAVARFHALLLDRVREIPGIRAAALASDAPPAWNDNANGIVLEGQPTPQRTDIVPRARAIVASDGLFDALGVTLRRGRALSRDDDASHPDVVVVNEAFARRFWPGENPLGKRFAFLAERLQLTTVVGVVADVRHNPNTGSDPAGPTAYIPDARYPWRTMTLIARTAGDPAAAAPAIQRAIARLDPALAAGDVIPLDRLRSASLSPQRLTAAMLGVFAGIALVLAVAGIYGIMSFSVTQRTHEIGVRMALGAARADVLARVMRHALVLSLAGIALGGVASLALTRTMSSLLYDMSPTDPATFAVVILCLAAAALLGAYLPGRRASRVDPMVALRRD